MYNREEQVEERIHNALSKIDVDVSSLKRKIVRGLDSSVPIQRNFGLSVAATLVIIVMLAGSVYVAVVLGVFDRFVDTGDLPYENGIEPGVIPRIELGEGYLIPEDLYAIDQGIHVAVVDITHIDDTSSMIRLSIRDVYGEGRVSFGSMVLGGRGLSNSFGLNVSEFDEETATAYVDVFINTPPWRPDYYFFTLPIYEVQLSSRVRDIPIPLPELCPEGGFVPLDLSEVAPGFSHNRHLEISYYDGILRIHSRVPRTIRPSVIGDIAHEDGEFFLESGERLFSSGHFWVYALDGEFVTPILESMGDGDFDVYGASYIVTYTHFPVSRPEGYTITLSLWETLSLPGDWEIAVPIPPSEAPARVIYGNFPVHDVDDFIIERIVLTPEGGRIDGRVPAALEWHLLNDFAREMMLDARMSLGGQDLVPISPTSRSSSDLDGNILYSFPVADSRTSFGLFYRPYFDHDESVLLFHIDFVASRRFDIDTVTAIYMRGVRIPLE